MKKRYRYDRDLDKTVEIGDNYFEENAGPNVIGDIEEYRTVAGDVANNGQRVHIGSRSRHREFLRDNNYVEVGNDYDKGQVDHGKPRMATAAERRAAKERRIEDIKRAVEDVRAGRGWKPFLPYEG